MTTNLQQRRSYSRLVLLVILVAAVLSASSRIVSSAAVNVPTTIRAALFINTGTSTSTSLTSVATLQSAGGLNIAWKDPAYTAIVGSAAPNQSVRFGMDGYRALVLETTNLGAAMTVVKNIQAQSSAVFVTQLNKSDKVVYQVSEGAYSTVAQASASLTKWSNAASAVGVQTLLSPRIAGPWAVEVGTYASAEEAAGMASVLGGAGLDAFVAMKPLNGAITYTVRVGQEKDASALPAIQKAAIAAGAPNATIPEAGQAYAVLRTDMSQNTPAQFYAIPNAAGVVLRADPAGAEAIQLTERFKRSYRGSMEMSVYNNSLAVINEVDLDHYLYSVVGTEVGSGWPLEAQKAQAVAARSYALAGGMMFKIANVVDTTVSQAYYGIGAENQNSTAGVEATKGEVLVNAAGKIISALFSSNAGGITADAIEGWGNVDPTYASAAISPDEGPNAGRLSWIKVATGTGIVGYVREDMLTDSSKKNAVGLPQMEVYASDAVVRQKPAADGVELGKLYVGEAVVPLDKVPEMTTAYSWVVGPLTPDQLVASLSKRDPNVQGPLYTLEVSARGPSGRATELKVNGVRVAIDSPDSFRSALGGVNSTLFTIEETGRMTIMNGQGVARELPKQSGALSIVGGSGQARTVSEGNLFIMDGSGKLRAATAAPQFIIAGKGWGHGIGMSQWGARGFAEQGYDYQYILQYYYKDVMIYKG